MPTHFSLPDFKKSKYTAIISDLHICEEEPAHPKYPLWKKYKTREFFFDLEFERFLKSIEEKANHEKVELVMNGDIFDFDSVLKLPEFPLFRIRWLERKRGLKPTEERSKFKIRTILKDHPIWLNALREFLLKGNRVIFVIGNHDMELHFTSVQQEIINQINLPKDLQENIRFVEWFYISNEDTLIEHGNQYDRFCVCEDPVSPFIRGYNNIYLKIPFGNLATRYIMNGLGFFNPHVSTTWIMDFADYIKFFYRYMIKAQPLIILTWFFGALFTVYDAFLERALPTIRSPLKIEDRVNFIAAKSNADPRMVRELKEVFADPASSNLILLAQELWLDRAFLIFISFYIIFQIMVFIKAAVDISFFWAFIPLLLMLPFFLFYSRSHSSKVAEYSVADEKDLAIAAAITKVNRVVHGHTHVAKHEVVGPVEYLNSGTWSPGFEDVECTKPFGKKYFIWLKPKEHGEQQDSTTHIREAELLEIDSTQ